MSHAIEKSIARYCYSKLYRTLFVKSVALMVLMIFLSVFLVMRLLLMFACFTWTGGILGFTDQSSQSGGFTHFGAVE